jgi:hypothetical protein
MDDIVSWGRERESRRWQLAAVALIVVLGALAVIGIRHLSDHKLAAASPVAAVRITPGPVQLAGLGSVAARAINQSFQVIRLPGHLAAHRTMSSVARSELASQLPATPGCARLQLR